jgi:hypothetical protein
MVPVGGIMPYLVRVVTTLVFFVSFGAGLFGCGNQPAAYGADQRIETPVTNVPEPIAAPLVTSSSTTVSVPSAAPTTEERTYFNFEDSLEGWEVPAWALGKADHVAKEVVVSRDMASSGRSSMKVTADFPGGVWTAALVEVQQYLDLGVYRVIKVDVYLPKTAPEGLKAKLVLTVGDNWKFVEMNGGVPLIPGEWSTITANIEPGSFDWKRVVPDEAFAKDVRKVAVSVESNGNPVYSGVFYVDNVRVGK